VKIKTCLLTFFFYAQMTACLAAEPIPLEKFELIHAIIKPQKTEGKWIEIPWMMDLWDARKKAAELGKPILLWEMDGHPLGCV
jgi:hypothetical protein